MEELRRRLRELAWEAGVRLFGVAELEALHRTEPGLFEEVGQGYGRAVSLGLRLPDAVIEEIVDRPTALYFHLYRQANYLLDRTALQMSLELQEAGFAALAVPASQVIGDKPMRGHISHRLIGWAAGLGWRGRNNLLVNPQAGSRFRLVTVLTDAPLPTDSPLEADCGSCRACMAVCPAGAIKEDPADFDLEACYGKLSEFRRLPYIGQHICGVCVKACRPDKTNR